MSICFKSFQHLSLKNNKLLHYLYIGLLKLLIDNPKENFRK